MITNESFAEYKKDKRFISPSQIKGKKTPYHYYYDKFVAPPKPPTEAMILGTAYHSLILEPEKFQKEYVCLMKSQLPNPGKDGRDAQNKEFKKSFIENAQLKNQIVLDEDQMKILHGMKLRLLTDFPNLYTDIIDLNAGHIEHNVYCAIIFDEIGTLKEFVRLDTKQQIESDFKGKRVLFLATRPDYFNYENLYQLDNKTTQDASPDLFARDVYSMEYHIQAAMGLEILSCEYGKEFRDFFFLAQEKTEPFMSANYHCNESLLEMGSFQYRIRLKHILEATESGKFKGYEIDRNFEGNVKGAIELYLPKWSNSKIENSNF